LKTYAFKADAAGGFARRIIRQCSADKQLD